MPYEALSENYLLTGSMVTHSYSYGRALRFSSPRCAVYTPTTDTAVDGVLTQEHASVHKPIAFHSKILTISEQNCSVHDYEMLAIIADHKPPHLTFTQ